MEVVFEVKEGNEYLSSHSGVGLAAIPVNEISRIAVQG